MMQTIKEFFTLDMIYQFANIGVIPLWLLIIFSPNSKSASILINNIFLPLILASTYIYLVYQLINPDTFLLIKKKTGFLEIFQLYLGIDQLSSVLSNKIFLLVFWIHFLSLSIFLGLWISKDAIRLNIHKYVVIVPLILTYFTGPVGLCLYLFLRIIICQKFKIHD
jgi:hypothetical protein